MENTDATDAAIGPGAECQPILAGFQLGGEIFLLTFPFIELLTFGSRVDVGAYERTWVGRWMGCFWSEYR